MPESNNDSSSETTDPFNKTDAGELTETSKTDSVAGTEHTPIGDIGDPAKATKSPPPAPSASVRNLAKDLQGASRLAIEAVNGVTDISESLHSAIHRLGGLLGKARQPDRTRGITGLVYNNVRTITGIVGKSIEFPLEQLANMIESSPASANREAIIAALNGVLGDHLDAEKNPLAIPMQFRIAGAKVSHSQIQALISKAPHRLVLCIHGLCMNDLQWTREQHNHALALQKELGLGALFLSYNSGRHISENGRNLADLLENALVNSNDQVMSSTPGFELNIIGHSMGGLVARSACYYAEQAGHQWIQSLKHMIFLGTPHQGAWLEKGGNWIDRALEVSPYSAPFARLGKIRSSGITDLRHGYIIDPHWQNKNRFEKSTDERRPVPLPKTVICSTIATTLSNSGDTMNDSIVGDGFVPLRSALGRHQNPALELKFSTERQWIGRSIPHLDLLCHADVYRQIRDWIAF